MNALQTTHPESGKILGAFLGGKSEETLRAYQNDVSDFADFLGAGSSNEAIVSLLNSTAVDATVMVTNYRQHLIDLGRAGSTINRRLSALRSLTKLARALGVMTFHIEVPGVKIRSYKDTRGPGLQGIKTIFAELQKRKDLKGVRDFAIFRLLFDLGLRRKEVYTMDLEHLDTNSGTIAILAKGFGDRILLTLPEATLIALKGYVEKRGLGAGPLFLSLDRARKGDGRLTGAGLYAMVKKAGLDVDVTARPHGIRHSSITAALDATGGNLRTVQRFSRHADVNTLTRYDDNRKDLGGQVAETVASLI